MAKRMLVIAAVVTVSFVIAIFAGSDRNSGVDTQSPKFEVSSANVPEMINYQGILTDGSGNPLDTTVSMLFTIYDASTGGTNLWSETHNSVTVVGGLFTVLLGSLAPLPATVFDGANRWLGLTVAGDPEMERERIASVPYAYKCGSSDGGVEDWGRYGVSDTLYEGTVTLKDKYVNSEGPEGIIYGGTSQPAFSVNNTATAYGNAFIATSHGSHGVGVWGRNNNNWGTGVYGEAEGNQGKAVHGYCAGDSGKAVFGRSLAPNAYAGYFIGEEYRGLYARGGGGHEAGYFDGKVTVTGDVGIGTTLPGAPLEIESSNDPLLILDYTGTEGSSSLWFAHDGTPDAYIWWHRDGHFLAFGTPVTNPIMSLTDEGNVGIGTSSPTRKLHVVGNSSNPILSSVNSSHGTGVYGESDLTGVHGVCTVEGAGVLGESDQGYGVHGSSNITGVYGYSSSGIGVHGQTSNGWAGYFSGKTYMSDNVGIGTMSPDKRLVVKSTGTTDGMTVLSSDGDLIFRVREMSSGSGGIYVYNESGGSTIRFSGTSTCYINNGSNLGIGTSSPDYKLHVIGDIAYTGNIYDVSDVRLKENITPLEGAIDKISSLHGIYFNNRGESADEREVGVIAQEVEEVLPEVVSEDDEGYKSVDYTKLTPLLIEAVKELNIAMKKLKVENEKLKAEIDDIQEK